MTLPARQSQVPAVECGAEGAIPGESGDSGDSGTDPVRRRFGGVSHRGPSGGDRWIVPCSSLGTSGDYQDCGLAANRHTHHKLRLSVCSRYRKYVGRYRPPKYFFSQCLSKAAMAYQQYIDDGPCRCGLEILRATPISGRLNCIT